jgi:hypothetical protein
MTNQIQRPTWQKPWNSKEAFVISLGILVLGMMLNQLSHQHLAIPSWPYNLGMGIIFSAIILFIYIFYRKTYVVQWLSGIPSCIGAMALFALVALLMGLIPQADSSNTPAMMFRLNFLKQSWLFLLSTSYLLICLGLLVLKRFTLMNFKNIGFAASHLGLWIIIFSAGLSTGDLERYQIAVEEGNTVSKGINLDYNEHNFPFSIQLLDFRIDEFPAKLAFVDIKTNQINTKIKNNLTLIEDGIAVNIDQYEVKILKYIPSAAGGPDSGYIPSNDSLSAQAALIAIKNNETKTVTEGWISSGSPSIKASYLKADSNSFFAMTLPDPKKFSSRIIINKSTGAKDTVILEVNKPYKVDGWLLYQIGYDKDMGKYSKLSILEAVRDPWIPIIYTGVFLLIAGAGFMFWMGRRK